MGLPNGSYLFTWVDYVLLVATVVLSLGIGLYQALSGGRQSTTDEYLLGNRKMRIFPVAVSMTLSYLSAIALLGFPAEMYYYGISFAFMLLGGICGTVFGVLCYLPVFYPLRLTSINEYLDQRFESRVVVLLGWFSQMMTQVLYMGIVLFAPAVMVEIMAGFPMWASMLLMGLAGTVYTTLGGLKAVVWTDFFQALVILAGLLTIVIKGISLTGGIGEVWYQYHHAGKAEPDFSPSLFRRQTAWSTFLPTVLAYGMMFSVSQVGVQRYSAVPTLTAAKQMFLWTILPFLVLQGLAMFSGVVAFSYFAKKGCEPLAAGYIPTQNQIMPFFVMKVLNYPGVPGVFCACVLCGSLSNLSSSLSAVTALTWSDLLSHRLRHLSERQKTMVTKIMAAGYGLLSMAFGFAVTQFEGTITQISMLIISGIAAPMMGLFTMGPLFPRINWKSVTVGVLTSMSLSMYLGLGSIFYATHQAVPTGDVSNCPGMNITSSDMSNMTFVYHKDSSYVSFSRMNTINGSGNEATTESGPQVDDALLTGWKKMFQISPYWIGSVSLGVGMVVGILASLIPGCHTGDKRTPHLYFPCIRAAMTKKHGKDEYQAVDVKGCDIIRDVDVKGCDINSNLRSSTV